MLKTKIKASAVNSLTDARYFAARGVEWLGFRLDDTPGLSISPLAVRAISEWVDGVKIVGEFDFATVETIQGTCDLLHLDAVQVGMFVPVAELEKLSQLTIFKEVVVENTTTESDITAHFQAYAHCCSYFLLDFYKAGISWAMLCAGLPLSIDFLRKLCAQSKVILALDFQPETVQQLLETLQPEGLNLWGGQEERIGLKSFEELDIILDGLEF